jgi:hypothetical protein
VRELPSQTQRNSEGSMNLQGQHFPLVVTLAAATATPACGQVAPTAAAPASAKESAASIPDLSGIWGRWFTFEQPPSGPGPVVSRLRRPDGTMILSVVGDYTNPILRPEAAATIKKIGEMELGGKVLPNPHNQCWRLGSDSDKRQQGGHDHKCILQAVAEYPRGPDSNDTARTAVYKACMTAAGLAP